MSDSVDIGHGVRIRYVGWSPDRELNPQHAGIPDCDRYCLFIDHPAADISGECASAVLFDSEVARLLEPHRPKWTVESWDPLTISPSVLCLRCGHHGWIQGGRWVPA
jgi:hypothetical protein